MKFDQEDAPDKRLKGQKDLNFFIGYGSVSQIKQILMETGKQVSYQIKRNEN